MSKESGGMGSSQVKILKELKAYKLGYKPMKDGKALDRLWDKGYVRWIKNPTGPGKCWEITKVGADALKERLGQ